MRCDLTHQQLKEKMLIAGVIMFFVTTYLTHIASFVFHTFQAYASKKEMITFYLYEFHMFEDIMALLLLMQVASFVIQLHSAFKQMNNRLGEVLHMQELITRKSLRDISNSYVRLCFVARNFNEENGFMIFVTFTSIVTSIFINSYFLILILCVSDGAVNQLFTIFLITIRNREEMTGGRTKCTALINQVLYPYSMVLVQKDLKNEVPFSIATDASNKRKQKILSSCDSIFLPKDGICHKILDFYEDSFED
ncbi:unnamed protein product [Parnassius apollo]|uniref:(apollo) hypothetical protein n=1 Tax=Parnassius apollo TaxID=110799 RepID=A0A8S3XJR0_PARAO|nr:unnamed protein product [Parnassius apollo]